MPKYLKPNENQNPVDTTSLVYIDEVGWLKWANEVSITDEYLEMCIQLASMKGGLPWRDGDGISPNTRYGIFKKPN